MRGAQRGGNILQLATDKAFLGRVQDYGTGLVQDGARYYDPAIGHFISLDPANSGKPYQLNAYAYAANNPASLSDPTGLDPGGMNCVNNAGQPVQCTTNGGAGSSNTSCTSALPGCPGYTGGNTGTTGTGGNPTTPQPTGWQPSQDMAIRVGVDDPAMDTITAYGMFWAWFLGEGEYRPTMNFNGYSELTDELLRNKHNFELRSHIAAMGMTSSDWITEDELAGVRRFEG